MRRKRERSPRSVHEYAACAIWPEVRAEGELRFCSTCVLKPRVILSGGESDCGASAVAILSTKVHETQEGLSGHNLATFHMRRRAPSLDKIPDDVCTCPTGLFSQINCTTTVMTICPY